MDRLLVIRYLILMLGTGLFLGVVHVLFTYQVSLVELIAGILFGLTLLGLVVSELSSLGSRK